MRCELAVMGLRGFPGVQGGVERHCESIVPHLGVRARVYRRKRYVSGRKEAADGIEFVDLPCPEGAGVETAVHSLLCVCHLLRHPARVVNVHNIGPGMLIPLLKLRGMRCVLTYHSANYLHEKWGKAAKLLLRFAEKVALSSADRVIFVSRAAYSGVSKKVRAKSVVIPNPVWLHPENDFCRERDRMVLAVGRLTPEKGYDVLVKAAQLLPPGWRVVIAGGEEHGSVYGDYLRGLDSGGRVEFAGYCDRGGLDSLYRRAGVFVLPSFNEGLSMALLEAMSWCLPVVVSDIEENRLPQLSVGDFFRCGDVESLSCVLAKVIGEGYGLRKYDLEEYSPERVTEAMRSALLESY